MGSSYGKRHGLPGYDEFRSGLDYQTAYDLLYSPDPDPRTWRHRSRGVVLGAMHEAKMKLYEQATDEGYQPERKPKRKRKGAGKSRNRERERTASPEELAEEARRVRAAKEARRPVFNPEQLVVVVVDEDDVF